MPISDLTNTTWLINNNPSITSGYGKFIINISCDDISTGGTYNGLAIGYNFGRYGGGGDWVNGSSAFIFPQFETGSINGFTLTFTGGADATNSTLISWLQNNATQITVSDLTNTTWLLNDTLQRDPIGDFYINFKSNNTNWTKFDAVLLFDDGELYYNEINVYSRGWTLDAFKTIQITGGTDVTNTTLITWLQTNATQLSVTDLSNTIWVFKNDIDVTVEGGEYSINFISNNTNYTVIRYGEIGNYRLFYDNTQVYRSDWYSDTYKTIEIISGTDATNTNLILWLQSNATQQEEPTPSGTNHTHLGSLEIVKKHFGNLEVIKEVLNGITIYEKGSPTPASYTVHFRDASPYGINVYDGQDDTGTLLVEGEGAGYETDVVCTTGYLYFEARIGTIIGVYVQSGNATATNPSVITGNASLQVQAEGGDG